MFCSVFNCDVFFVTSKSLRQASGLDVKVHVNIKANNLKLN